MSESSKRHSKFSSLIFIGFIRIVIAVFCPSAFKKYWIEYRGSEKIPQLQLSVHVCSLCNLSSVSCRRLLLRWAKRCSLCCGVCCCLLLLCCSRWILTRRSVVAPEELVLPGENLHPLFECRIVVFAFLGQLHWRNCLWFTDSTWMKHNTAPWTGKKYLSDLLWSDYTILS